MVSLMTLGCLMTCGEESRMPRNEVKEAEKVETCSSGCSRRRAMAGWAAVLWVPVVRVCLS